MRRLLTFPCQGETLAATLDGAGSSTGLLIVSGGNELRIGAHRGMARLAAEVAAAGWPVLRFDRRGIGDSTGINGGFRASGPDIAAAANLLRTVAGVDRIVAFGNCDAATALAIHRRPAAIDMLVLANPWVVEPCDDLPPVPAIRARYATSIRSVSTWRRLLRGEIDMARAMRGLSAVLRSPRSERTALTCAFAAGLADGVPTRILLAEGDNTALSFADQWRREPLRRRVPVRRCATASHGFAGTQDAAWLREQLLDALRSV